MFREPLWRYHGHDGMLISLSHRRLSSCALPSLSSLLFTVTVDRAPAAEDRHVTEKYLISGDLAGGQKALAAILKAHPDDGQARFGLGAIQFVRAVEHLVQGFYKHGLQPDVSAE